MTRPDRRSLTVPAVLAAAAAVLVVLGVPGAFGRLTAGIGNANTKAASNAYYLCTTAAQGNLSTNNAYLAYPFVEGAGPNAGDISGNARTGTYSGSGITYRTTGAPCKRDAGGYAIKLDGVAGYVVGPNTAITGPNVFSLETWFKTSVAGGKIIGFGSVRTGSSGNYDRHLYIDSTGLLQFGVYPNAVKTIDSPSAVTDGKWHHAVATLSSAGMVLYLDGVQVDSNTSVTTAQSFNGYWRIGYDNTGGWTNSPSNYYFNGELSYTEVYAYALTAEQAKSHYLAGTG